MSSSERERVGQDMDIKETLDRTFPRRPLMRARNAYYTVVCNYYAQKNRLLDDGYGQWDRIEWVSPEEIRYITYNDHHLDHGHGYLNAGAFNIITRAGARSGGRWDTKEIEFEELHIYTAVKQRYLDGCDWQDTRFFEEMVDSIESGDSPWGCTSIPDLWDRCEHIETLLERIRTEGYRSQRSLGKVPVDEVTVNIGRNGTLFFNDGRHRLTVAKVLNLDEIPVRVLVIHDDYDDCSDRRRGGLYSI